MLPHISLFSGYEGFGLGLTLAGIPFRTVLYCEIENYPQEIIRQRIRDGFLDDAPIWPDVRSLDGRPFAGKVGLITAGFPCQPHSVAGQRRGADDERNLWPETARIIGEVRPRHVHLENVPGILSGGAGRPPYGGEVTAQLAALGYVGFARTLAAGEIGASHWRERWWVLANSDDQHWSFQPEQPNVTREAVLGEHGTVLAHTEGQCGALRPAWPPGPEDFDGWREALQIDPTVEPSIRRVAHGHPHRMDRIRALGNGIVPPMAAAVLPGGGDTGKRINNNARVTFPRRCAVSGADFS